MNLIQPLRLAVAEQGDAIAIRHEGGEISYSLLMEAVDRFARGLQRSGVTRSDRIVLCLPNTPHWIISYYAILRLGAVVVPLDNGIKPGELRNVLNDCEAQGIILSERSYLEVESALEGVQTLALKIVLGDTVPGNALSLTRLIARNQPITDAIELDDDDPAVVQYSFGQSGRPKGAELSHRALAEGSATCRELLGITSKDTLLGFLPLNLPMAQTLVLNLTISAGASVRLFSEQNSQKMSASFTEGAGTIFVGYPSMFRDLCREVGPERAVQENVTVRLSICGGDYLGDDTLKDFEKKYGSYLLECYVVGEAGGICALNQWRSGRRTGSLGHPLPGVEIQISDGKGREASIGEIGEVVVRGPNVMRKYINRPVLTAAILRNGWLRTGDFGRMDINGFFYLTSRNEDRIISNGYVVHSKEIEDVLSHHPDVEEVAVIGIPDEYAGELVKACVVLKQAALTTSEMLLDYCGRFLARQKMPGLVRLYRDLPRTPEGKIQRTELRA